MPELEPQQSTTLESEGIFFLNGDITDQGCGQAIRYILEANYDPNFDLEYITLLINSQGGNTSSGFALIDIMNGSKIPIRTVGIGIIASMGLLVFLVGQKGLRTLTPNTMIMSHQWTGGAFGKQHELVAGQKHNEILSGIINKHYKKYTSLTDGQIKQYLLPAHDVWLTAKECKKLGICDIVKHL